jgi:hypothetical protein
LRCVCFARETTLSKPNIISQSATGGGFFGDILPDMQMSFKKVILIVLQMFLQLGYAYWNFMTLFSNDEYDSIGQSENGLRNSESQTEIEIT